MEAVLEAVVQAARRWRCAGAAARIGVRPRREAGQLEPRERGLQLVHEAVVGSGAWPPCPAGGDAPLLGPPALAGAMSALSSAASAKRLTNARMELSSMSVLRIGRVEARRCTASAVTA